MDDEFYIGWQEKAPPAQGRFLKKASLALVVGAGMVAALLVGGQPGFYPSVFEFLQYKTFEGVVYAQPYPILLVERPGLPGGAPRYSRYYLVQEGKFGAHDAVAGLDGRRVRLEGALIYRDDQTMVEIRPGTVEAIGGADPLSRGREVSLGTFTLQGQIVDSKCFLGVMNPGSDKPHRACAVRCISGGIPPVFMARDAGGNTLYLLLEGSDGRTVNQEVLPHVAEPLEITGEVVRMGGLLVLKAEPDSYRGAYDNPGV